MTILLDYKITDTIHEGEKHIIYRGEKDNKKVVIKQPCNEYPTLEELKRIQTEFELLQKFAVTPSITKAIALEKYNNTLLLVFEDIAGDSLFHLIGEKEKFDIKEFLNLAIETVKALGEIHRANVIHKDIKPQNIIYDKKTNKLEIIDFGSASLLSKETPSISMANALEGTLAYISPEQTGRMNRMVDYRTDFYSLGVAFYQMVTGKLPFESVDPMELIHSHIAVSPASPEELGVPKPISNIILKLMSKNAEDRYQSAYGLLQDLEWCLQHIENLNQLKFTPGQKDVSLSFRIPEKLYGREPELNKLFEVYEQACSGPTQIILVNGLSGIGKTALVNEIHKPIVNSRGYFISGKFDPMKRNMPYRAFIYAFQDLVKMILTESGEAISKWKTSLLDALGSNGKVITEVIPELELIIGEQPPVVELTPTEAQNRFNLVFQNFVKVFATKEHPLVIFLDDLQWTDIPSINLLQTLYTATDISHMLFILSYRVNEVDAVHPFMLMLQELKKQEYQIEEISLGALKKEDVNQLIADTLQYETSQTEPLSEIVHSKTAGNPFFVNELLTNIYQKDMIYFRKGKWQWDLSKIGEANISGNVIDLLVEKVEKLSKTEQDTLKLISCIGSWFYVDVFYSMLGKEESETKELLTSLANSGFISIGENKGKFVHDRVKEALYGITSEEEKENYHYKIGKTYLELAKKRDSLDEHAFTIVNQLNNAVNMLSSEEREMLLDLDILGANKALASSAYEPALNLIQMAEKLLPENSWDLIYEKTFDVYTKLAKLNFMNGMTTNAENYFALILKNCKIDIHKVNVSEIKILLYLSQNKPIEAIQEGKQALSLLGVEIPDIHDPTPEILKVNQFLENRKIEDILGLPRMEDEKITAAMKILSACIVPAYIAQPSLMPIIVLKKVNLSLEFGNYITSPISYAFYGVLLCNALGNVEAGIKFGELAIKLVESLSVNFMKSSIYFVFAAMINHWKHHAKKNTNYFIDSIQAGFEFGDFQYGSYSSNYLAIQSFLMRNNLINLMEHFEKYYNTVMLKFKLKDSIAVFQVFHQFVINLRGDSEDFLYLKGSAFDEDITVPIWLDAKDAGSLTCYYYNKGILAYLANEFILSNELFIKAKPYESAAFGMMYVPEYNFFQSLTNLSLLKEEKDKQTYLDQVKKNQERMKVWAENCEANYGHKYHIVEAEINRLNGNIAEAINHYDTAIKLAIKHEYILEEAIANELAGKFWLKQKNERFARICLTDARYAYERWGCKPKVKQLEAKYPAFTRLPTSREGIGLSGTVTMSATTSGTISAGSSGTTNAGALDIQSVLKASQTLSGEVEFDKLLEKMMRILFENAGAEKGVLILVDKSSKKQEMELSVEAEGDANKNEISVLQHKKINQVKLPQTIINYVSRAKKEIVLDDASKSGAYTRDPYIQTEKPKSVLCYPVISQGKLVAMVYLENNLTTNVFTVDRLEIMKILASQLAISIDNAELYDNLEGRVKARTKEIGDIMNNVEQGILTLNPDYSINPDYSKKVIDIFNRDDLGNKNFISIYPEEIQKKLEKFLLQLFKNKFMAERMFQALNPLKEYHLQLDEDNTKILSFHFSRIYEEDRDGKLTENIQKLMVVIDDKTAEHELQQQLEAKAKEQAGKVEKLYQILNLQPSVFTGFLKEGGEVIAVVRDKLSGGLEKLKDIKNIEESYRAVHTLKGNARALNLDGIGEVCHKLEDELDKVRNNVEGVDDKLYKLVQEGIDRVEFELKDGNSLFDKILGMKSALQTKQDSAVSALESLLRNIVKKESEDSGKKLDFSFKSELDEKVTEERLKVFKNPLLQIVRNSIGHGLEEADGRKQAGKPEIGKVSIMLREEGGKIIAECRDDGRGLDASKLKAKAVEKKVITPAESENMSDEESYMLIFRSGFSTAEKITGTSGRGVGMDIVKSEIENAGGHIKIQTKLGEYTKFIIGA
ncbi:MAG: AAA family ATPase [Leptospiraceae bacterium]|nr:AAA family ATPase [Leptospiraceae bacterium]